MQRKDNPYQLAQGVSELALSEDGGDGVKRLPPFQAVVDLAACESRPDLLLSTAKDGTTRVWDWQAEACLAVLAADATVASWTPLADGIVTGHSSGALQRWSLPPSAALAASEVVGSKRRRVAPPAAPDAFAKKVRISRLCSLMRGRVWVSVVGDVMKGKTASW